MEGLFEKIKDYFTQYLILGGVNILKGKKVVIKNHLKNRFGGNFYFELQHGKIHFGNYINARRNFCCIVSDGGNLSIGSNCYFNNNCSITCLDSISIGKDSTFGNNLVIVDHDHDFINHRGFIKAPVVIGERVWIGANVTILKGSNIGNDSVIAAGSIVSGNIPSNSIYIQKRTTTIKNIL